MFRRRLHPLVYILLVIGLFITYNIVIGGFKDLHYDEEECLFRGICDSEDTDRKFRENPQYRIQPVAQSEEIYDGRYEVPTRGILLNVTTHPELDKSLENLYKVFSLSMMETFIFNQ